MHAYKPEGRPTVVPRIFTPHVAQVAKFLKTVFGATGEVEADHPADIRIGESVILISDGGGVRDALASYLYVYVPDVDAAYDRAVAAGAQVVEGPINMPYGDRRATVVDPWGNTWQIATRQR